MFSVGVLLSTEENPHNPKFVTTLQCKAMMAEFKGELDTIKYALVGKDLRGGIVKDVADIKSATGFIRSIGVPILVAVVTAAIVYWFALPFK